ncbi:MAG: division/cell wall cluster transcriptional repressor MraZ [Clostridia bacterium]|nr:division/cell wall cluster transcriptional repressor MraZ [Clostridia bacterium]
MSASTFSGNFTHNIDPKGRVTIPASFRSALGNRFTIGLNNDFTTLALYPEAYWHEIEENLKRIPQTDIRGMKYVRLVNGNSFPDCELDGQGRVLLPPTLRQHAKLERNVRFVGVGQYVEIWDEDRYLRENMETVEDPSDILNYVNDSYFKP